MDSGIASSSINNAKGAAIVDIVPYVEIIHLDLNQDKPQCFLKSVCSHFSWG